MSNPLLARVPVTGVLTPRRRPFEVVTTAPAPAAATATGGSTVA